MPAYFDSGFSVREPMWHGLGMIATEHPASFQQAREWSGRMWEPEVVVPYHLVPVADARRMVDEGLLTADEVYEVPAGVLVPAKDHGLTRRSDTNAVLGRVSADYTPVTNADEEALVEALLMQPNVKIETQGVVQGGKQTFTLILLDEPYTVAGDDTQTLPYLAILNDHSGSGAFKALPTNVRVVCWNTYQAASLQGDRTKMQFVFRHQGNVRERIDEARDAIAGLRADTAEWQAIAEALYALPVDDTKLATFTFQFLPEPPADVVSDRVRNNIDHARATFKRLYLESPTNDSHRGTALGLLDASVEYLDHLRVYRDQSTYLGRTLLRPEPLKARALKLVREVCG